MNVHEDVELTFSPVYSNGMLKLTPVVTYIGEDPAIFTYEGSIARVESVKSDEDVLYEYKEGEQLLSEVRSTLEKDDERYGNTIELEVEPGMYHVYVIAEYWLQYDEEGKKERYYHTLKQTIEVKK